MKILYVYKTYLTESVGGVEQFLAQLANGLTKYSVTSRILCLSRKPNPPIIKDNDLEVFRYRQLIDIASTGFSVTAIKGFRQLAQWADLIHYQYPWPFGDVLHFLGHQGKPTVLTYHADIIRQQGLLKLYRPLQKCFLTSVNKIAITSPNYALGSEVLKPYLAKTSVIPLGLNQAYYPASSTATIAKWQAQFRQPFLLFVGVLRYYKGLLTLLDACRQHRIPVVILGSGPLESELKLRIATEQLTHVNLIGPVSEADKIALLELCHGVILPSQVRSEAFGLALVEGAMFAKPLISCEIGTGTSFINQHLETGFVVPPNDPIALGKAMKDLIDDPVLAKEMGNQAYARYQAYFTADKMCAQYQQLYQSF